MNETGLIQYDVMCRAIEVAHDVCVVKEMRDQAITLEQYAAQAQNMEAERKACEIRLRAERKTGELLREMDRAGHDRSPGRLGKESTGHREPQISPYAQAKADANISDTQAKRWQKLAGVDQSEFESALGDPEAKPTTSGIIRKHNGGTDKMNPSALWLWGRLRDFEKRRIEATDARTLAGEMTDTMRCECKRIIPCMMDYLSRLAEIIDEQE